MKRSWLFMCCGLWTACAGADEALRMLDAETSRDACARYEAAFQRPEVRERLEEWYRQLPKRLDRSTLELTREGQFPGATYTMPLGFDPVEIGLRPNAQVEVGVEEDGTITLLSISDDLKRYKSRVMYSFKTDHQSEDYFQNAPTMRQPPGENVGVRCYLRGD